MTQPGDQGPALSLPPALAGADTVEAVRAEHTAAAGRLSWLQAEPVPAAAGARHTRAAQVAEAASRLAGLAGLLSQMVQVGGRASTK